MLDLAAKLLREVARSRRGAEAPEKWLKVGHPSLSLAARAPKAPSSPHFALPAHLSSCSSSTHGPVCYGFKAHGRVNGELLEASRHQIVRGKRSRAMSVPASGVGTPLTWLCTQALFI